MNPVAVVIQHQTLPGRRQQVIDTWMRHMAPAVTQNPGHLAYFYCADTNDADRILAFQQYRSPQDAQDFLKTPAYAAYLKDVEPLLSGPPQVTSLQVLFTKPAP